MLDQFGAAPKAARRAYRRFVAEGVGERSPWRDLRGGIWLGAAGFRARMQERPSQAAIADIPAAQRQPMRPTASEVIAAVAEAYDLAPDDLLQRRDAVAFRAAVYLLRRAANLPLKQVAGRFGISTHWVSRIQRRIERGEIDRRLRRLLRRFNLRVGPRPPQGTDRDVPRIV